MVFGQGDWKDKVAIFEDGKTVGKSCLSSQIRGSGLDILSVICLFGKREEMLSMELDI